MCREQEEEGGCTRPLRSLHWMRWSPKTTVPAHFRTNACCARLIHRILYKAEKMGAAEMHA